MIVSCRCPQATDFGHLTFLFCLGPETDEPPARNAGAEHADQLFSLIISLLCFVTFMLLLPSLWLKLPIILFGANMGRVSGSYAGKNESTVINLQSRL